MKKYLILLSTLLFAILLTAAGCTEDMPDGEGVEYDEVKELIAEDGDVKVRGSCNVINDSSSCVDFIGSIFTEERMKLSCEGAGEFSFNSCPYSELGGCQGTGGTITESIIWSYGYGGQPISVEEAGYQAKACNAIPGTKWVTPDEVFLK